MIRTSPEFDKVNGFFVACFECVDNDVYQPLENTCTTTTEPIPQESCYKPTARPTQPQAVEGGQQKAQNRKRKMNNMSTKRKRPVTASAI
jgi:hypothetical protein